jgi:NAD-dependent SIR2 family protein deacetylase
MKVRECSICGAKIVVDEVNRSIEIKKDMYKDLCDECKEWLREVIR